MNMHAKTILFGALLLAGFAAHAADATDQNADQADAAKVANARDNDPHCLRYTGSFIVSSQNRRADMRHDATPADADSKPKHRCIYSAGRVYTREDIQGTGQSDIGSALQMLDPSVTIGH